jgi:hypothetical protein
MNSRVKILEAEKEALEKRLKQVESQQTQQQKDIMATIDEKEFTAEEINQAMRVLKALKMKKAL